MWRAAVAPLVRWADEVWRAVTGLGGGLDLPELRRIWDGAMDSAPMKWGQVRGPVGAALLSAKRIGWSWHSPFALRDADGTEIKLTEVAPRMFQQRLQFGVRRVLEVQCSANLHAAGYVGNKGRKLANRVSFGAVAKVTRARKDLLEPIDRGCLLSVATGALWTRTRLHQAGYVESNLCTLCHAEPDTEFHRWWECSASATERDRLTSNATRERALAAGSRSLLFSRGIVEHPDEIFPLPAAHVQQRIQVKQRDGTWTNKEFHGFVPDGLLSNEYDLYTDGSCSTAALAERRRAGWAVVWADVKGTEVGRISGVVPRGFPQTPQAAEYLAALAAAEVAQPGHEVFCDCLGVVRHFAGRTGAAQLSAKLRYSGVVRLARGEAGWQQVKQMSKVPAHVDLSAQLSANDLRKARGNAAADEAAKAAVSRQPQATEAGRTEWDEAWSDAVATARLIASVGRLWPAARQRGKPPKGRAAESAHRVEAKRAERELMLRARAANWGSHHWARARGHSRCHFCKVLASNRHAAEIQPCPRELQPWAQEVLQEYECGESGHRLLIGLAERPRDPPSAFLVCSACGGFGEFSKSSTLAAKCRGHPSSAGAAYAIRRTRNGLYPRPGAASQEVFVTHAEPIRRSSLPAPPVTS